MSRPLKTLSGGKILRSHTEAKPVAISCQAFLDGSLSWLRLIFLENHEKLYKILVVDESGLETEAHSNELTRIIRNLNIHIAKTFPSIYTPNLIVSTTDYLIARNLETEDFDTNLYEPLLTQECLTIGGNNKNKKAWGKFLVLETKIYVEKEPIDEENHFLKSVIDDNTYILDSDYWPFYINGFSTYSEAFDYVNERITTEEEHETEDRWKTRKGIGGEEAQVAFLPKFLIIELETNKTPTLFVPMGRYEKALGEFMLVYMANNGDSLSTTKH